MQNYLKIAKRIWGIYTPFHKYIYLQLVLTVLLQIISVTSTGIMSKVLSSLVDKNIQMILLFLLSWLLLNIMQSLLNYFSNWNNIFNVQTPSEQYLQEYSLKKILNLTIEQHISDHSAIKREIVTRGESAIANFRNTLFQDILPGATFLLIALGTLLYTNIYLGLFAISICIIIFFWTKYFLAIYSPLYEKDRRNWVEYSKVRTEAFSHLPLVKYLAGEDGFVKKYIDGRQEKLNYFYYVIGMSTKHRSKKGALNDFAEFLGACISVYLFLNGSIALGTIYLVFTLNSRAFGRITQLQGSMRSIPMNIVDIERYFEVIDKNPSFNENGLEADLNTDIKISNLSFALESNEILSKVNTIIKKGTKTALVGVSGSGKSTLIKILLRSYSYKHGSILIGDTELSDIDARYIRKHTGYVEQFVDLFDDSIKNNILFGLNGEDLDYAIKNIEDICKKSRITEFYHRLQKTGLDTLVGERGVKLSGGERQRVGIARALARNPEILIFDEATSALDTENEQYIKEAIDEASKGRTTIIIAHRLSTVRDADKIIVMDKGTVVAEGTHEELLQTSSHYQTLIAHQISE